jgi:hypothetical protein
VTTRRIHTAPRRFWSSDDDALMRARYPHEPTPAVAQALGRSVSATYGRADVLGLRKSDAYLASPHACRLRRGGDVGAATRFTLGQAPPNKGLRRPGWSRGRMRETQFKTGALNGRARQLLKPVGAERVSKDGYLERKVHNDVPARVSREEANRLRQRRWRAVHLIVWEAAHGPLPKGHAVCFKNCDKRDIRVDNLELVKRTDLMQRNSIHHLPPALKETVQLLGRVNRQIRKRERHAEEPNHRSA